VTIYDLYAANMQIHDIVLIAARMSTGMLMGLQHDSLKMGEQLAPMAISRCSQL
jgi:hypothetical protein